MLIRILAPFGRGKTTLVLDRIREALEKGKRAFWIVPEQATATAERRLLDLLPAGLANGCEVTNFQRLRNIVLRSYGQIGKTGGSDVSRKILLFCAAREHTEALETLGVTPDKDGFCRLWADLNELHQKGNLSEALMELTAVPDRENARLTKKLETLFLLDRAWREAMEKSEDLIFDETEDLARILTQYPFFRDSAVFVDGFWDFTAPERAVLSQILVQASDLTVTFACEKKNLDPVYEKPYRAAARLLAEAKRRGVSCRDVTLPENEKESAAKFLSRNLLRAGAKFSGVPGNVRLIQCPTLFDEAVMLADEIKKRAMNGTPWGEIAVLSRNGAIHKALALVLDQYAIPYFWEEGRTLEVSDAASLILCAVRLAKDGRAEDASLYLKNPLASSAGADRYYLEKYVHTWDLERGALLADAPYTKNPLGFDDENDRSRNELRRVNRAKELLIDPIKKLRIALSFGSVEEKTAAIASFLQEIDAPGAIDRISRDAFNKGDYARGEGLIRDWNAAIDRLTELARLTKGLVLDEAAFYTLLSLAFSGKAPGALPAAQDAVFLGNVAFAHPENVSTLFLADVTTGVFPEPVPAGGVFNEKERDLLRSAARLDLISGDLRQNEEAFYFAAACACPRDELVLSYLESGNGEDSDLGLGLFGKRAKTILPLLNTEHYTGDTPPLCEERAWAFYLEKRLAGKAGLEALETYFLARPQYRERLIAAQSSAAFRTADFLLIKELPDPCARPLSFSRIDRYNNCHFSYFLEYLLGAKKTDKAEFAAAPAGSFVHAVLEDAVNFFIETEKNWWDASEEDLEKIARRSVERLYQTALPRELSARAKKRIGQAERLAERFLAALQKEIRPGSFVPVFAELDLEKDADLYRIDLPDGKSVAFKGKIDRVDLYRDENGTPYVRVVDYKTGKHGFSLQNIQNGLDTQMLLYLFALWDNGWMAGGKRFTGKPAGVLYMKRHEQKSASTEEELKKLLQTPDKAVDFCGMLLNEGNLVSLQDPDGALGFLPQTSGKGERKTKDQLCLSLSEIGRLRDRVEAGFRDLIMELKAGCMQAHPLKTGKGDENCACSYCPYGSICKAKNKYPRNLKPAQSIFEEAKTDG